MNQALLLGLGVLGMAASASAANYSNEVLSIGVGARGLGMGGAYTSVADDSTAVYWNPAALPKVKNMEVSAVQQGRQTTALALGTNDVGSQYFFMSGAMSLAKSGTIGAAIMRFGVDGIQQTAATTGPSGEPIILGEFKTEDLGFIGSYGYKLHPAFNAGLSLKYLYGGTSGLKAVGAVKGDAKYNYLGADLAMLVNFGGMNPALNGLAFGLNLQDLGNTGVQWSGTTTSPNDKVDLNPKVGLSYSPQLNFLKESNSELTFAFDADPKYGSNTLLHYGGEFWYKETLAFRGGLRQFLGGLQQPEASIGVSFRLFILQVDYSYINYELTPIHYLSLAVRF